MLRNFKLRMPIFLLEPFSFVFLLLNRLNHKSKLNGKGVLEQKKREKKAGRVPILLGTSIPYTIITR